MSRSTIPIYEIDAFKQKSAVTDFYCNSLKEHLQKHHFIFVPHKHDFYFCVLFTKGTGTHEIDFVNYKVKPGSVFFLSPGQIHNWKLSKDVDGFIFFHSKNFYELAFNNRKIRDLPFFYSIYNSPTLHINNLLLKTTGLFFNEVSREYSSGSELLKSAKLCSLIDLIYIDLAKVYLPKKRSEEKNLTYLDKLRKLEDLIDKNFKKNKSAAEYANQMNMTAKHLNRICQACLNKTTSEIISDRVILEAKRMLMQPGLTVSQIADELGFFDLSYFNRLFKKKTTDTPLQFANKFR